MTKKKPILQRQEPVDPHEMGLFLFREFNDKNALTKAISEGFDLRTLSQEDRDIIAQLVSTGTRKKGDGYTAKGRGGEKIPRFRRDLEVCSRYACLLGVGIEHPASEIAREFGLSAKRVRDIWQRQNNLSPEAQCEIGQMAQDFQLLKEFRSRIHEAIDNEIYDGPRVPRPIEFGELERSFAEKTCWLANSLRATLVNACEEKEWLIKEGDRGPIAEKK